MATDLFFIRHGESYSNVEGRLCGDPPGPGLTPRGLRQAEAACRKLEQRGITPGRLLASPLRRALETARPASETFGLPVDIASALRETRFGKWEGRLIATLSYTATFQAWIRNPEVFPPPGGERLSDVGRRVQTLVRALGDACPGQSVLAFSHMHALLALVMRARNLDVSDSPGLAIPNATIVHVRCVRGALELVDIDTSASQVGADEDFEAASEPAPV